MRPVPYLLVLPAWSLAACIVVPPTPPASPGPAVAPGRIEVALAPEDRELLERLLARVGEAPAPRAELAPLRGSARREHLRAQEGPVLHASYQSGAPMYDGRQARVDDHWERTGPWHAWYANGQSWEEGAYLHGEEHGAWKWWYEDGTPQATGSFEEGRHVGAWVYYHPNGQVMAEGSYADDFPTGHWRTFHENGAIRSEGDYDGGLRTGRWSFFEPDGSLDARNSGVYAAGERAGD